MDIPYSVSQVGEFKTVLFEAPTLMSSPGLTRLTADLEALAAQQPGGRLLLDFSRVEAISSQAIGMIVALHKKVAEMAGGQLVLAAVSPQLLHLLSITKLDRLLKIVKTPQDVVK